jgi:hypothetical protein
MGYSEAIESNGLKIKEMKEFGSYQGTWIAILEDGRFIEGSYGSCSGCDAFQAEFNYDEEIVKQENGKYYPNNNTWEDEITEGEAIAKNKEYSEKLKSFGKRYTDSAETKEEIVSRYTIKCNDEFAWDDDKEILEWLKTKTNL